MIFFLLGLGLTFSSLKQVSLKYDSWHKDALSKFGNMLSNEMTTFHTQISKARLELLSKSRHMVK